jgi:hypothetical protein
MEIDAMEIIHACCVSGLVCFAFFFFACFVGCFVVRVLGRSWEI